MVPPPEGNEKLWETLSKMRRQMKDPGYFRWPPHANRLYPFLKLQSPTKNDDDHNALFLPEIVEMLESATKQISPFSVRLQSFGTFGGKKRGVLWLHPDSTVADTANDDLQSDAAAPLIRLQSLLEKAFPMCKDQSKQGTFTPHMTISHFPNNNEALEAQQELEESFPNREEMTFVLDRIYLLERKGDDGQFLRVAEVALGTPPNQNAETRILDPPQPFAGMPSTEEEWVYMARMEMKARRNKNQRRRRNKSPTKEQASTPNDKQPL
ncbi:MAG: hypothetical protein SGARI_007804 [Bacillariaceae sp.]